MLTRRLYAYGGETLYWDDPSCIGFVRLGIMSQSTGAGLAVTPRGQCLLCCRCQSCCMEGAGEILDDADDDWYLDAVESLSTSSSLLTLEN